MSTESSPQIKEAVVRYRELTAEERIRLMYEYREKARRDYVSDMNWAREQGLIEGKKIVERTRALSIAQSLLSTNLSIEEITRVTDLTYKEIEDLRNLN